MRRWLAHLIFAVVALVSVTLAVLQARADSMTVDEGVYVSSGVVSLVDHRVHLTPEHPPLPKVLAAAGALIAEPAVPETGAWRRGDWFQYADDFWAAQGSDADRDRVLFLSRLGSIASIVLSGAALYALGSRLAGRVAGLLGAGLWLTLPHVVGVGHLATTDLVFAAALAAVALAFLRHLDQPSDVRAIAAGVAVAVAMCSRHVGLALVPVLMVVTVVADRDDTRSALRRTGLGAMVAWLGVWLTYRGLAPSGPPVTAAGSLEALVAEARDRSLAMRAALSIPWPVEHRAGLAYLTTNVEAAPAYLLGHAWQGSRWWYFPALSVVKVPLVPLLAGFAGLVATPFLARGSDQRFRLLLAVYAPAAVVTLASLLPGRNIGLRYLLGPIGLGLVLGGAVVARLPRGLVVRAAVAIAVVFQLGVLLVSHPHSLAWASPLVRAPYQVVTDSDVDWGQDRDRFGDRVAELDGSVWVALLAGRGSDGIVGTRALARAPRSGPVGWVAVSASLLTAYDRDRLAWLRAYCPVEVIGRSILLYRFDEPPDTTTPGPTRPAGPCEDAVTSHR